MPIVSSTYVADPPLSDGRFRVTECHTDHLGRVHIRTFIAAPDYDPDAGLLDHAAELLSQLGEEEFSENLQRILTADFDMHTDFLTLTEHHERLRAYYAGTIREETCQIALYLDGLDGTTLGTMFGVSGGDLALLQSRISNITSTYTTFQGITGE